MPADDLVDVTAVLTWPQAVVAVVLILAVLVWPTIAGWVQARRAASAVNDVKRTLTTNNGGSHVKDSLDRIEATQREHGDTLDALGRRVAVLEQRRSWWVGR